MNTKRETEFERLSRENRKREDVKDLNKALKVEDVPKDNVQNLNNCVGILTGEVK